MPDVIVPRKAVGELRKLLEEALDGKVEIDLSPSKIRFTLGGEGGVVLTSKLIDGTFPDYYARHSDRQRQAPEARSEELLRGRRPRGDDRHREDPRGQDGARDATRSRSR